MNMDNMQRSSDMLEAISRRLTELEQGDAQLARPLDFYRKLLPLLRKAQPLAPALEISSTAAQTLMGRGQSILASQPVVIADGPAQVFFREICEVIVEFQPAAR